MRIIAKFFLWLVTCAIPVVIAACYGMAYRYSKTGHVIDSETKEGIQGIEVTCLVGSDEHSMTYTGEDGYFWLEYDVRCDKLRIDDVDGEDNGGLYVGRTVDFCKDCEDITIELHK